MYIYIVGTWESHAGFLKHFLYKPARGCGLHQLMVLVQRLWMNLGVKVLFCWPCPPVPAWRHRCCATGCGTMGQGRHQTTSCSLFL